MAQGGVDCPVGREGIDEAGQEGGQAQAGFIRSVSVSRLTIQSLRKTQNVKRQEVRAKTAQGGRKQQCGVTRQRQIERDLQRQSDQGVEKVIGVEDQINAQREPDQIRV